MSNLVPITGPVQTKQDAMLAYIRKMQDKVAADHKAARATAKVVICGPKNRGKSTLLATAPKPLYIDSFDPSGTLPIQSYIDKGLVFANTSYEHEDYTKPWTFKQWVADQEQRKKDGFFDMVAEAGGTIALDGSYMLMVNMFAYLESKFTGKDRRQLYGEFVDENVKHIYSLVGLPCNFIMTAHVTTELNTDTGEMETTFVMPGKASAAKIPIPFPEIWLLGYDDKTKERYVTVGQNGRFCGGTKSGSGKFEAREKPDISAMLRKCGFVVNDWTPEGGKGE